MEGNFRASHPRMGTQSDCPSPIYFRERGASGGCPSAAASGVRLETKTFNEFRERMNELQSRTCELVYLLTREQAFDGNRVEATTGPVLNPTSSTYFIGSYFEQTEIGANTTYKKYYFIGGARVAMSEGTAVKFLLTDHLGSITAVLNSSGISISNKWYYPWGGIRYGSNPATAYGFTGQWEEPSVAGGIDFYNARWYDPQLGRFLSADSIVPGIGNLKAFDRYAYVQNNPIKYTDPSGHVICNEAGWCGEYRANHDVSVLVKMYGITFDGGWSLEDKVSVLLGVMKVATSLSRITNNNASSTFKNIFGPFTFHRSTANLKYWGELNDDHNSITFHKNAKDWVSLVAHELGHAFQYALADKGIANPYNELYIEGIFADDVQIAGYNEGYVQPGTGEPFVDDKGKPIPPNHYIRTHDGMGKRLSGVNTQNEDFADMFMNWSDGTFTNNAAGQARNDWMTTNITEWINPGP
jgi:RHS repeat-associated protein